MAARKDNERSSFSNSGIRHPNQIIEGRCGAHERFELSLDTLNNRVDKIERRLDDRIIPRIENVANRVTTNENQLSCESGARRVVEQAKERAPKWIQIAGMVVSIVISIAAFALTIILALSQIGGH